MADWFIVKVWESWILFNGKIHWLRAGVGKIGLVGWIWPAKWFHPACSGFLSLPGPGVGGRLGHGTCSQSCQPPGEEVPPGTACPTPVRGSWAHWGSPRGQGRPDSASPRPCSYHQGTGACPIAAGPRPCYLGTLDLYALHLPPGAPDREVEFSMETGWDSCGQGMLRQVSTAGVRIMGEWQHGAMAWGKAIICCPHVLSGTQSAGTMGE